MIEIRALSGLVLERVRGLWELLLGRESIMKKFMYNLTIIT